jgi:predicted ATPase
MDNAEIQTIRRQFKEGKLWSQFLESVRIDGLRGLNGQLITFQFPVVALAGENGSGKSTVLKVAASAYRRSKQSHSYHPGSFFVSTYWDRVENVTLGFRVRQGPQIKDFTIRKENERWSFLEDRPQRSVLMFHISRILPLDAPRRNRRFAQSIEGDVAIDIIEGEYLTRLSHILGREYSDARFVKPHGNRYFDDQYFEHVKYVGLLQGEFGAISQFHQGAGEDTTLDLFRVLQSIPQYSLLIIDEVEASLHPRAQRRLVQFFLWLSRQKRIQVILSTHSPYILQELPPEARILLLRGPLGIEIIPEVTPEFAMSWIDEDMHPELYLFCEDKEACVLLREIIASHEKGSRILPRLSITAVGPANAVQMLGRLTSEDKLPYKGYGVLDGDQEDKVGCIKLPANEAKEAPERMVFKALKLANWRGLPQRFGIEAGTLFAYLEDAMLQPDSHQWTTLVGNKVLKTPDSVWEVLANQWCKLCLSPEDRDRIVNQIEQKLLEE